MRKFFRFASYTLLYILVTFASAVGVVFISSSSGGDDGGNDDGGLVLPPQITQIMERISSANALDINLEVDIATANESYTVTIDALADTSQGLENISVEGTISAQIGQDKIDIEVLYANGTIYLDMFNGQFKLETANILESVTQILQILNIEIPELGIDFSSLNMDTLLSMLSNISETKGENSITLKISLPIVGDLEVVCDLNYSINQIVLPSISVEGTTISLFSNIAYPEEVTLENPDTNKYVNITDVVDVASTILSYLDSNNIGLNLDVKYGDFSLSGSLSANLEQMDSILSTTLLGYDLNLIAIDNIIYLEFGNLHLQYDLEKANLITDLLYKHFGIDIPLEKITDILISLNKGNLMDTISTIMPEGSSVDIEDIDLSIIESFVKDGDTFVITLKDIGTISCTIVNKQLSSLSFEGFGVEANVSTIEPKDISLSAPKESYSDISLLIDGIDAMLSMKDYSRFDGTLNLKLNEQTQFNANYSLSIGEEIKAKIWTTILNKTIAVAYQNENIYISIDCLDSAGNILEGKNIKLKANNSDIEELVEYISSFGIVDSEKQTLESLLEIVKPLFDINKDENFIDSITATEEGIEICAMGAKLSLFYSNTIDRIAGQINDIYFDASILSSNENLDLAIEDEEYISTTHLLNIVKANFDLLAKGDYAIEVNGNYQDISFNGGVNYVDGKISLALGITIGKNNFVVKFVDNIIYAEIDNLNISVNLADKDKLFTFIQDTFGVDIEAMLDELLSSTSTEEFDIKEMIKEATLSLSHNDLTLAWKDISAKVVFLDSKIENIQISYKTDLSATVKLLEEENAITLEEEYFNISSAMPFVSAVYDYILTKQFNIQLSASQDGEEQEGLISGNLQIDLADTFKFNGQINLGNDIIEANVYDGYIYANYNGLLLKMATGDFEEILVILMEMIGIDPSILPFLEDVANNVDVDISGLEHLFPELNTSDPLSMIKIFKSLSVNGNSLDLALDGKLLGMGEDDLIIKITLDGNKLLSLHIENLPFGDQIISLDLTMLEFNGVTAPDTTRNYVDLSNANSLIKAIINTSELDYYHITGTLNIPMNVIGIKIDMFEIPFDIQVKLVDRVPEIMITIGEIPIIPIANADGNTAGSNRMAYAYYKDGFFYLYRTEKTLLGKSLEKMTKIHYSEFFRDPMSYFQFLTGFSDTIIDAINEAIALSSNRETPMDMSKIVNSFTANKENFTLSLNLAELANNPDLDSITIGLQTINNESTNGKDYLAHASLDMFMPFADAFEMNLKSDNIALVDIGKELDFASLYNFVNRYDNELGFGENENWSAENGSWTQGETLVYTLTFIENGGEDVADITTAVGSPITLPVLTDRVETNKQGQTSYTFDGWYTDDQYKTKFEETSMPRGNYTLYAKWIVENRYIRTLSFQTYCDKTFDDIVMLEGENITLPTLDTKKETEGYKTTTYSFDGWYSDENFTQKFTSTVMPSLDTTLYAKWEIVDVQETRSVKIYDNGVLIYDDRVNIGEKIPLEDLGEKYNSDTLFYLDEDYQNQYTGDFTVSDDMTLHIRNKYTLVIESQFGDAYRQEISLYQGETFEQYIKEQYSYVYDDGTQTEEVTYTFNGYDNLLDQMPNQNWTISANWSTQTKYYYTVSFDLRWYLVLGCTLWSKVATPAEPIPSFKVLEGTTVDLTEYRPTCRAYLTAIPIDPKEFVATSWGTSAWSDYTSGGSGVTSIVITADTTLYACWEMA